MFHFGIHLPLIPEIWVIGHLRHILYRRRSNLGLRQLIQ